MSAGRGVEARGNMKDDDYGKPIVHVEGVEKGREEDTSKIGHFVKKEKEPEGYFHEGETIKTTYTVEEDTPSLYQRLKGKFTAAEYQVRSMVADYTQKANPYPEKNISVSTVQTKHKPHGVSQLEKTVRDDGHDHNTAKDGVKGNQVKEMEVKEKGDAVDETAESDRFERFSSAKDMFASETTEDRKVQAGDELGTGYEESSEEGGVSSESDASGASISLPKQGESPFKPFKPKDNSELTLDELRASKLNQNSSAEDVKAPGMFTRVKEEVDAITDKVSEGLGLKGK